METNFKGTKGKVFYTDNGNGQIALVDEDLKSIAFIPKNHVYSSVNLDVFKESIIVRQQINCSLTELLEQRNELLEVLEHFVNYCYGTELQETNRFKKGLKAIERCK